LLKTDEALLDFLPTFYVSYAQAIYRYKSQLFSHAQLDGYRTTVSAFLASLLDMIDRVPPSSIVSVWGTRVELLRILCKEGGYIRSASDEMLTGLVHRAVADLGEHLPTQFPIF
jgi:hypothetical protein